MIVVPQTGGAIVKATLGGFPLLLMSNTQSRRNFNNPKSMNLKVKASLSTSSNFPLASRIMVTNLGYSITESTLLQEFSNFGEIAEVKLVKDEITKRSKAYAFIQYTSQDDAVLALENMDHKTLDGRLIYVELAKPRKGKFRGCLKTCGPPKKQHVEDSQEETRGDAPCNPCRTATANCLLFGRCDCLPDLTIDGRKERQSLWHG